MEGTLGIEKREQIWYAVYPAPDTGRLSAMLNTVSPLSNVWQISAQQGATAANLMPCTLRLLQARGKHPYKCFTNLQIEHF